MSSNLVRLFTCASVLSLSGLTAAVSTTACSSDSTASPPSDDDDDTAGDDDDDGTKRDAGGSSSGSTGEDAGDDCNPIGTWTLAKPTFIITTPGAVCDQVKAAGEKQAVESEVTIAQDATSYTAQVKGNDGILRMAAVPDGDCEVGSGLNPIGFPSGFTDADGKAIEVRFDPTQIYAVKGDKITSKLVNKVTSVPEGASGTPCYITQVAEGTRKK